MSHIKFLKSFIKKPGEVGAIMPSSRFLAQTIVSDIGIEKASAIVELGPGTGAFTRTITQTKSPEAHFFAIERNTDIFEHFKEAFPDVKVYHGCASELGSMMREEGVSSLDVVVSGLPWAAFSTEIQQKIIGSVHNALKEDGVFTTFAYLQGFLLPAAHRFRSLLKNKFKTVETSKVVWRNAPPAFVYRCWK
jgi:phosphatidylethanolamine/phosphatidyl-N-methylethanolamine N-methyltransferase